MNLYADPIIIKRHELYTGELKEDDKIVLLLRNPANYIKASKNIEQEFLKYFALILEYDAFKGDKMVLYYQQLNDPVNFMVSLSSFFNWTKTKATEMRMYDLDADNKFHMDRSFDLYKNTIGEKGCDLQLIPPQFLCHPLVQNAVQQG